MKYDGWAARAPSGDLILTHVGYSRQECINSVLAAFGRKPTWKRLYRNGWRAVKIRLVAVD